LGQYSEAIRSSSEGDPLIASLRGFPPENVEVVEARHIKATRNRLGTWNVPGQVSGADSEFIFDTGANFSAISESEAMRVGVSNSRFAGDGRWRDRNK
jgi:predicted aspartyl protease